MSQKLEGWSRVRLLEVAPINSDLVDPKKEKYKNMVLVAPDHIEPEGGRILSKLTASRQNAISNKYLAPKDSVIYSKIRPYLKKVAVADENILCSADMYPLGCTENILPEYLKYILLSNQFTSYANSCSNRTGIPKINREELSRYSFILPPRDEQAAIVDTLFAWDKVIEKVERLIVAKKRNFLSLCQTLISLNINLWKHLRAEEVFSVFSEKKNGNHELLSVTQDRGVIPRAMLEGRVMSPESGTDTYKLIKPGDFAISLRSFQGGIEYSEYEGLISPAYTVLRAKLGIRDDFYKYFFKSDLFIKKYLAIAVIGIRDGKQISIPDFMAVKIPYPPIKEQKRIADLLNMARKEISLLEKQSDAYRKQKRGLMQKLLTGEWRVNFKKGKAA